MKIRGTAWRFLRKRLDGIEELLVAAAGLLIWELTETANSLLVLASDACALSLANEEIGLFAEVAEGGTPVVKGHLGRTWHGEVLRALSEIDGEGRVEGRMDVGTTRVWT
jgi:hypothetical protein